MKLRTLCASALLGTLAVATVGAVNASADGGDATKLAGTGHVEVEEGTLPNDDSKIPDPENPGEDITPTTPPTTNEDKGTLSITRVSPLEFNTIKTLAASQTVYANEQEIAGDKSNRGNYVTFGDIRSGKYGYTVKAAMSKQFTKGTETLTGATITFKNVSLNTRTSNLDGTENKLPLPETQFVLKEDGESQQVVTATEKNNNKGKGEYILEFGRSANYDGTNSGLAAIGASEKGTAAEAVQLDIPANTSSTMTTGDYTAEITWTIEATPGADDTQPVNS